VARRPRRGVGRGLNSAGLGLRGGRLGGVAGAVADPQRCAAPRLDRRVQARPVADGGQG